MAKNTTTPDRLLTPAEAAALLRVTPRTLANWRGASDRRRSLPYLRIGSRVYYDRTAVRAWVAAHTERVEVA